MPVIGIAGTSMLSWKLLQSFETKLIERNLKQIIFEVDHFETLIRQSIAYFREAVLLKSSSELLHKL